MKNLLQKLFFGSIVVMAFFVLAYSLWLYANWQIGALWALFLVGMSLLAVLWFGWLLNETPDNWPLSIRYVRPATLPLREHRVDWKRPAPESA